MFRPRLLEAFCLARQPIVGQHVLQSAPSRFPKSPSGIWNQLNGGLYRHASSSRSSLNKRGTTGRRAVPAMPAAPLAPKGAMAKPPRKSNRLQEELQEDAIRKSLDSKLQHSPLGEIEIAVRRKQLLWPGVWTVLAVCGTIGALAFLDAKFPYRQSFPEPTTLPQTWWITPAVVTEGIRAGWKELDKLSLGILVVTIGVHVFRKSPLGLWAKLLHVTGVKKYTAFTYQFAHYSWTQLSLNMFALCWFMPGVIRYLDGDLYQAAAIFFTMPLLSSYLDHFAFRFGFVPASVTPLNVGSSGALAAFLGAYCWLYPHEKIWTPHFLVLRIDALYIGIAFALSQMIALVRTPKTGTRSFILAHIITMGMGTAYVYFDGKEHFWKPLVARFSVKEDEVAEPSSS